MNVVIIGGGVTGLMAAMAVRSVEPGASITLLERAPNLGGLLSGIEYYDQQLYFDLGTHIYQETGYIEYDKHFIESINPNDLLHYDQPLGDLSGSVFNGRLQSNSHFPDLRFADNSKDLISKIKCHLESLTKPIDINRNSPLLETASERFGKDYAESILGPILSHLYNKPAEELSGFSLLLPGLTRIILEDFDLWNTKTTDEIYRAIVAVPDQRDLPAEFQHGRKSFYSKNNGSRAFIDGIAKILRNDGSSLICSANVESIDLENQNVSFIATDKKETVAYDHLILSTGAMGASHLLGVDRSHLNFDMPMPHLLLNVRLTDVCKSDLCYLIALDNDSDWYRITNYRAFSGNEADRRITIEILGRENLDEHRTTQKVLTQLSELGFLDSNTFDFCKSLRLPAGFPSPTQNNINSLSQLGSDIGSILPSSAILTGVGSNGSIFFQNEVAPDSYRRTLKLIQG